MKKFLKHFSSRLVAVLVSATLVAALTPVAGVFADEVSSDAIAVEAPAEEVPVAEEAPAEVPVETPAAETPVVEASANDAPATEAPVVETPVVETPAVEAPVAETPVEETPAAETPVVEASANDAPATEAVSVSEDVAASASVNSLLEKYSESITEWPDTFTEDLSGDSLNRAFAASTQQVQYYYQPSWYPNTTKGYDAICAYITDEKGEYASRCFFVTDGTEWLLYDYGETAATEFFAQTELKDGKYIPVQKGKSRTDNVTTVGIDESKIPVLTRQAFEGMVYDWRTLANVPFTRDGADNLIYAGTNEDPSPTPAPTPTPTPTPDPGLNQYVFTVDSNTYEVRLTKSVSFNGRRHVAKWAKNTAKQCPDLDIQLYRNNQLVESGYYTVKYYNNLNVNGYNKELVTPYITINLKNVYPFKTDRKQVAAKKFGFSILPVDIAKVQFTPKKVRVATTKNGVKVTLNSPTAKISGVSFKVTAQGAKNPRTGYYTVSYVDKKVVVYGVNNFSGSVTLDLSAARTMDYVF